MKGTHDFLALLKKNNEKINMKKLENFTINQNQAKSCYYILRVISSLTARPPN